MFSLVRRASPIFRLKMTKQRCTQCIEQTEEWEEEELEN